jgi:hypothetical protein
MMSEILNNFDTRWLAPTEAIEGLLSLQLLGGKT